MSTKEHPTAEVIYQHVKEDYPKISLGTVYRNLTPAQLTEHAILRGEGRLADNGALVVYTGKYTGRSPDDKFIVDTDTIHDDIAWGKVNRPISRERFDRIRDKAAAYLQGRDVFIFDGFAGADEVHRKKFRIINELASQNMFIHQLLIVFFQVIWNNICFDCPISMCYYSLIGIWWNSQILSIYNCLWVFF